MGQTDRQTERQTDGSQRCATGLKEGFGGPGVERAVLYDGLAREVLSRGDGHVHPLDGEERRQVGRVRGDNDQSEEPPDTADHPTGRRPTSTTRRTHGSSGCTTGRLVESSPQSSSPPNVGLDSKSGT